MDFMGFQGIHTYVNSMKTHISVHFSWKSPNFTENITAMKT